MNDRFKFRCGITISHYDDDENDIDTFLLINDVSVFDDGDVGFNRESLKEAVKRKNLSEEEERTLWNSLDEYEVFEDWYQMPADFIEQCTGRKDINGTLIYEGDLVMVDGYIDKYKVIWDKEICSFAIDHIAKFIPLGSSSFASVAIPMVIIGNIHNKKVGEQ